MDDVVAQRAEPRGGGSGQVQVVVIDGNSLYSRAFFASISQSNTEKDDAVAIGMALLLPIIDPAGDRLGVRFDRMLWCWDTKPKRDKQRTQKPPDFEPGLARFKKAVRSLLVGAAQSEVDGYEADDQVATAVYRCVEAGDRVVVVSSDKDLHQLTGHRGVRYYCLNNKSILSSHTILSKWGVKRPIQIAIAQAIIGDPGDAIKGVRGWGARKVSKLFEKVTADMSIEQALDAVTVQITEQDKLAQFYESLELTFLNSNVPGVPEPAPFDFELDDEVLETYGLQRWKGALTRLHRVYADHGADNELDELMAQ